MKPLFAVSGNRLAPLLLLLLIVLPACARPSAAPTTVTVLAAASLTAPFTEIGREFEAAHPEARVVFSFGGSNQLAEQINQGALADVFASANPEQMERVIESGRVAPTTAQTFARNRLVVIFPADNPAGVTALRDLARPGLKLVLASQEVPVGRYALDFLEMASQDPAFGAGFRDDVLANVVSYEENVKAVLTKVALGEADAGVVYASDIVGADAVRVARLAIPDHLNIIATYPIAPLADSAHAELAQAFVDYVLSAPAQAILARYGLVPVVP